MTCVVYQAESVLTNNIDQLVEQAKDSRHSFLYRTTAMGYLARLALEEPYHRQDVENVLIGLLSDRSQRVAEMSRALLSQLYGVAALMAKLPQDWQAVGRVAVSWHAPTNERVEAIDRLQYCPNSEVSGILFFLAKFDADPHVRAKAEYYATLRSNFLD